jgi:hypothetical protein
MMVVVQVAASHSDILQQIEAGEHHPVHGVRHHESRYPKFSQIYPEQQNLLRD